MADNSSQLVLIDRASRDQAVAAIDLWFDGPAQCSDCIKQLEEIKKRLTRQDPQTCDATLLEVITQFMTEHEDDDEFPLPYPNRGQWHAVSRLQLLLASDAAVIFDKQSKWMGFSYVAALGLALYVASFIWLCVYGTAAMAIFLSLPFAAVSWPVWFWRNRCDARWGKQINIHCYPFASKTQMMEVRRRTPGFVKRRYVKEPRVKTGAFATWLGRTGVNVGQSVRIESGIVFMTIFSPLVLFMAAKPLTRCIPRLRWQGIPT